MTTGGKAKEAEPNNLEVQYNEVNLLEAEGKPQEALALMKKVVDATAKRNYSTPERASRIRVLELYGSMQRSAR